MVNDNKSAAKAKVAHSQPAQPQASLADIEYLMSHAIGRYHDQYLQQLALNAVKMESMQEIMAIQEKLIDNQVDLNKNKLPDLIKSTESSIIRGLAFSLSETEDVICKIQHQISSAVEMLSDIKVGADKNPNFDIKNTADGTYSADDYNQRSKK